MGVLHCLVMPRILSSPVRNLLDFPLATSNADSVADMGQGAAQAVEDAATLAALLPLGTTVRELPDRLKIYEHCRKERVNWAQETSRLWGTDGAERSDGELRYSFLSTRT